MLKKLLNGSIDENIKIFFILSNLQLLIYAIAHYLNGDLNKYSVPFTASALLFFVGYYYYIRHRDYIKTLLIFFIASAIAVIPAFILGGLDNTGYIWSIMIVAVSYLLLPTRIANEFAIIYISITFLIVILHIVGLVHLPYKPGVYITTLFAQLIIVVIGNSVLKELQWKLLALEKLVNFDYLTKAYSRRKILEILEIEISRTLRYKRPLTVLLFDVDNFKQINDTFGHSFGDEVLKNIIHVVKKVIRSSDYIGRLGGEEFLIILPETNGEDAYKVAEKIRKEVENFFEREFGKKITISVGLFEVSHEKPISVEEVLHFADLAMYHAKKTGKNRVSTVRRKLEEWNTVSTN